MDRQSCVQCKRSTHPNANYICAKKSTTNLAQPFCEICCVSCTKKTHTTHRWVRPFSIEQKQQQQQKQTKRLLNTIYNAKHPLPHIASSYLVGRSLGSISKVKATNTPTQHTKLVVWYVRCVAGDDDESYRRQRRQWHHNDNSPRHH